jgi:hypothetical protein
MNKEGTVTEHGCLILPDTSWSVALLVNSKFV